MSTTSTTSVSGPLHPVAVAERDCDCDDAPGAFGTIRLDSAAAVDNVLYARVHWRVFVPRLQLVLPSVPDHTARELQRRIDKLADACGCDLGAALALIFPGIWLAYAVSFGASFGLWGTVWRAAVVMFAGATVGKLVGIARARIQLRRMLLEVRGLH